MAESSADFESHGLSEPLTQNRADYTVFTRRSGERGHDQPGEDDRRHLASSSAAALGGRPRQPRRRDNYQIGMNAMYRDPMQWKRIRDMVLKEGQPQRRVSRDTGLNPGWYLS